MDEFLHGTRNFWNRDEEEKEKKYDYQDVFDLEQEKIQLIAQCTKLEQETDFLGQLYQLGRQFSLGNKQKNQSQLQMSEKSFSETRTTEPTINSKKHRKAI